MIRSFLLVAVCTAFTLPIKAATLFGVTANNRLVSFDTSAPSTFLSDVAIFGLKMSDGVTSDPNAVLVNLTWNADNDTHYGIDTNANFYSLSKSGVATLIDSTFSPTSFAAGLAYDPFSQKILFASDAAENVLFATNGTRTANPAFAFVSGDANFGTAPKVFGAGIDPDFGDGFFVDADLDILATTVNPNFSELSTVGALGVNVASFGGLYVDLDGILWGSLSTDGETSSLFTLNTSTGAASLVGGFGAGVGIHSLAAVPEPSRALFLGMACIGVIARRRRSA
jgi:hypothetical protein